MEITTVGSQPSAIGPEDWFTGAVRSDPLFRANEARCGAAASVTFKPGARTAWHTHPLGQTLLVTAGYNAKAVRKRKFIPAMSFGLPPTKSTGMALLQQPE